MEDCYNLQRFVEAQAPVMDSVMEELQAGCKQTHWMWFVFPQLRGLGRSPTAIHYALSGSAEARAYLAHPVLGNRLRECCQALLALSADSPERVLGDIDAMKLHSSMTLFAALSEECEFADVLRKYFRGSEDKATLSILSDNKE